MPVVELLGGVFRDRVEVYTHFGGSTPEAAAAHAQRLVELGFRALKGGMGSDSDDQFDPYVETGDPRQTAARFEAVRQAVGPDVKLFIDCHGRLTVSGCIRLARVLEPFGLYAFEDPVPPDDLSAYPKVRHAINIPVMGSERLNTRSQFRQLLDLDGVDIAQPDLMYAGGLRRCGRLPRLPIRTTFPFRRTILRVQWALPRQRI